MSDTTTHLGIPKPNRARVPALNVDEEFDQLALAWDTVDAFLHALALTVAQKAGADHEHAMSAITGLVDALNAKMSADRQFSLDDLTDVDGAADAPVNWILVKGSGGLFVPSTALAALGVHPHLISEVTGLVAALNDRPTRAEVSEALDLLEADMTAEILKRGVPLGTMVHSAVPLESQGFLLADGSPCTPTTPDLRTALLAADSPFGHNGVDPLLPNELTGNRFRRAAGGSLALGAVQDDAFQAHGLTVRGGNGTTGGTKAGPTATASTWQDAKTNPGGDVWTFAALDPIETTGGVPRTANETRPKGIAYLPYIKAFGVITIEGMADLSALFNALATKAEAEAGADNTKLMTALRTKEAIDARKGTTGVLVLSGAQFDVTGIPEGIAAMNLTLSGCTPSAAAQIIALLGTPAGFTNTGYVTAAAGQAASATSSTGRATDVPLNYASNTTVMHGTVRFERLGSTNTWTYSGTVTAGANALTNLAGGVTLGGELTRIRLTTAAGTATLSGSIEVEWEK